VIVIKGALFLDGGINVADIVFGEALFKNEDELLYVWKHLPLHPLQVQCIKDYVFIIVIFGPLVDRSED